MTALRIGLAGLGTVGCALAQILVQQAGLLRQRSLCDLPLVAVSARDQGKARPFDCRNLDWFEDAVALAQSDSIDVFVEAMGGADGVAYDSVRTALQAGKSVVTANKALLARHGVELAALAEEKGVALCAEAAVAGAIPALKALAEGLAANRIRAVEGILNGTCNYILTEMEQSGADFATMLAQAQKLGYAEADPAFDIDGVDAAHKLALLAAIAYGTAPDMDALAISGIRAITAEDLALAQALGGRIRLVGMARQGQNPVVSPLFLPENHALAQIAGVTNAVRITGDAAGSILLTGAGAGGAATASALAADIVDIARGTRRPLFGIPAVDLQKDVRYAKPVYSCAYVRLGTGEPLLQHKDWRVIRQAQYGQGTAQLLESPQGVDIMAQLAQQYEGHSDMLILPANQDGM